MKRLILIIIIVLLFSLDSISGSETDDVKLAPFKEGERLVFDISWFGITAGKAIMEVKDSIRLKEYIHNNSFKSEFLLSNKDKLIKAGDDKDIFRIGLTAKSSSVFSVFYFVEDHFETIVDLRYLFPYYFNVKQHEGNRKKDREVIFDQENNLAITLLKGKEEGPDPIEPSAHNSLSSLYYFRLMPAIKTGESVFIDVYENRKNWKLEIKAITRETITTPIGTFDTVKVKADVQFEGVFINKGDVYVWFTDDEFRVPVQMKSKIAIGYITATLVEKTMIPK